MSSRLGRERRPGRAARIAALAAVFALPALVAGCGRAGTSFHGAIEMGQWTPTVSATAVHDGGTFDVTGTGGVVDDDAVWSFDVALQFGAAARSGVRVQSLNLGYVSHTYSGSADLSNLSFGNVLDGATTTDLSLSIYKLSYGEPQAAAAGGNNRTEGLIGLQYLDFSVNSTDEDGTTAEYSGNAPMFVIGWKVAYTDRAVIYFFSVEWMDLDFISLENVTGMILDYSAGFRWNVGTMAALSIGYRSYEADLDDRGEQFDIKMDGAFFSLFMAW